MRQMEKSIQLNCEHRKYRQAQKQIISINYFPSIANVFLSIIFIDFLEII